MRRTTAPLLAAVICVAAGALAQRTDITGSRDHPLVPPYAAVMCEKRMRRRSRTPASKAFMAQTGCGRVPPS